MGRPVINIAGGSTKFAEVSGTVTLGPESAKKYGLPVGHVVDLGTLAVYHKNPLKRFWSQRRVKKHLLNP